MQHQRAAHHLVGLVHREVLHAAHVGEQVHEVVAVEMAGRRRQPARQVHVADDVHAVLLHHLPGLVHAQLPPFSAARSTITDPRFMLFTISSVMRTGAGLLGMSAVVMMMSTSRACAANISISALMKAGLISLRVAAAALAVLVDVELDELGAHALDLILHRRAGVEGAHDGAQAAGRADGRQPATPAPMTSTLAAGTLPAAVIWPVKKRP